jgi:hypothetical protein
MPPLGGSLCQAPRLADHATEDAQDAQFLTPSAAKAATEREAFSRIASGDEAAVMVSARKLPAVHAWLVIFEGRVGIAQHKLLAVDRQSGRSLPKPEKSRGPQN